MHRKFVRSVVGLALSVACLIGVGDQAFAKTKLTIMGHYNMAVAHGKVLKGFIDEYEKLNSNVQIEWQFADVFALPSKIAVGYAAGTAPDIVHIPGYMMGEFAEQKMLKEVPADVQKAITSSYVPGALSLSRYKGKMWTIPTEFMMRALTINTRFFEAAGLEPEPPRDWKKLADVAGKLTKKDGDDKFQVAGMGIETSASAQAVWGQLMSFASSNGATLFGPDGHTPQFNAPEVVDALQYLVDLANRGIAWAKSWYIVELREERIAMGVASGPYWRTEFLQRGKSFYDQFVSGPIPVGKGKSESAAYGWGFAVTETSKNASAAYDFLLWLTTKVQEKSGTTRMGDVLATLGSMPTTKVDLARQTELKEPFMKGFIEIVRDGLLFADPVFPKTNQVMEAVKKEWTQAFLGKKSPRQALDDANKASQLVVEKVFGKK